MEDFVPYGESCSQMKSSMEDFVPFGESCSPMKSSMEDLVLYEALNLL